MEKSGVSFAVCFLIIIFTISSGCFENEPTKNAPPKIQITVDDTVYNDTYFCFDMVIEDPDGNITQSRNQWDFDNDGDFDLDSDDEDLGYNLRSEHHRWFHSYKTPGEYTARLRVTDEDGMQSEKECKITVISHELSLETSLNKNIYLIDESIALTTTLKNSGPIPINVSEMNFHHSTLGESEITTPEGYTIQSYLRVSCMPDEITINNNGQYTVNSDLSKLPWGIWDGETWTDYNLTQRGKYTLQVIYDSYPIGENYKGTMKTDPISFVIV
jgi:PKD repeat protein